MNVRVVCVGHSLRPFEETWISDYSKRLSRSSRFEIVRVKEGKPWNEIQRKILPHSWLVVLDPNGKLFSTEQLTGLFSNAVQETKGNLTFLIGGSHGLPPEALKLARIKWSLSPLTLPHRIALLLVCEQIYRVFSIRDGSPYHH